MFFFLKIEYEMFQIIFNFYNKKCEYYNVINFSSFNKAEFILNFINIIKSINNNILIILLILKL